MGELQIRKVEGWRSRQEAEREERRARAAFLGGEVNRRLALVSPGEMAARVEGRRRKWSEEEQAVVNRARVKRWREMNREWWREKKREYYARHKAEISKKRKQRLARESAEEGRSRKEAARLRMRALRAGRREGGVELGVYGCSTELVRYLVRRVVQDRGAVVEVGIGRACVIRL